MSNPVVKVSNNIPVPGSPSITRKSYLMRSFEAQEFFIYSDVDDFDPSDMGHRFYLFHQLKDVIDKPEFLTSGSWDIIGSAQSGYVTPNKSIMPKRITPSSDFVGNGIAGSKYESVFNWMLEDVNGEDVGDDSWKYVNLGINTDVSYVCFNAKANDQTCTIGAVLIPQDRVSSETFDASQLVVGGAFSLILNVTSVMEVDESKDTSSSGAGAGAGDDDDASDNRWGVTIEFGDVTMEIGGEATMSVSIKGEDNVTSVNLAESLAKEESGHSSFFGKPITISVYPVWNGICVVTGNQETKEVVHTSSTFCRKLRSASIQDTSYCKGGKWFNTSNPKDVEITIGNKEGLVLVDFGEAMFVEFRNCNAQIAYSPSFFSRSFAVDGWKLLASDSNEVKYKYNIYTIYTKNGTGCDLGNNMKLIPDSDGEEDGTKFWIAPWELSGEYHTRYGGEIFAYVLETEETRTSSIKNGNGSFNLSWSGGVSGSDSGGHWSKYIQSVVVSTGLDGSNGSITIDKYGLAGQDAKAIQSVGALVLSASGGFGTKAGTIFSGLAMGVSESSSSGDSTWSIPLVGLEKKLEDICLINPPFMDGETIATAVGYLAKYAGIRYTIHGNASRRLSGTVDIMDAVFNWTSGTSIATALNDVMVDTHFTYVIIDGVMHVYELGDDSLPKTLGPNRSEGYDSESIVSIDKTPDFEDLRNYSIGVCLQRIPQGTGTKADEAPVFPMIVMETKSTTPDIPWAKCWVNPVPGVLERKDLEKIVDKMNRRSKIYELTGSLSIPGNADIKPYDKWDGENVVSSVTHNLDFSSKSWTTDLEFMRKA